MRRYFHYARPLRFRFVCVCVCGGSGTMTACAPPPPRRYVWCPDDDLRVSALDAGVAFEVASSLSLGMAQPSILVDDIGRDSIGIVQQVPGALARRTNYVECQSPMFSSEARDIVLPHLDALEPESGFGLDTFWSVFCERAGLSLGVVDVVATAHTKPNAVRPDGSVACDSYFVRMDINPWDEAARVCNRCGLDRLKEADRRVSREWRAPLGELERLRARVRARARPPSREEHALGAGAGAGAPVAGAAAAAAGAGAATRSEGAAAPAPAAAAVPAASTAAAAAAAGGAAGGVVGGGAAAKRPAEEGEVEEGEVAAAAPAKRARTT
jgi:hypothetical protein